MSEEPVLSDFLRSDEMAWLTASRPCLKCEHRSALHDSWDFYNCLVPGCDCKMCACDRMGVGGCYA